MEEIVEKVFDLLSNRFGYQLVQLRFVDHKEEIIQYRNGLPYNCGFNENKGVGIRIRMNDAWGFAATDDLSNEGILDAAELSWRTAKASSRVSRKNKIKLSEEKVYDDKFTVKIDKDPFDMNYEEKASIIEETNLATSGDYVKMTLASYRSRDQNINLYTSDGNRIEQRIMYTGVSVMGVAVNAGEIQSRNLQNFKNRGWEAVEEFNPLATAIKVRKELSDLVTIAERCPVNLCGSLILEPYMLGLTIHESTGHPTELDRVLGYEADFAGTSWMTPDKIGTQYGNELVNITQDPSMHDVLGSFKYDDEGVKARPVSIIKNGIFTGYQSDREHASILGEKSSGNSRAENFGNVPIIRMNNMYLETPDQGSDGSFKNIEELIEDTKNGIYALNWKSHSIDDKRLNFQFNTQIGYRIIDGEIKAMLKDVTYQGISPEFWGSTSGLTRESQIYGLPYCGKGSPTMQVGIVSHGGPWTRFEDVRMGI